MEIQMYTEQRNTKALKSLYHKALSIQSAIPHPRILGIIRECGGKMHMHDGLWDSAATDFFEVGDRLWQLHVTSVTKRTAASGVWVLLFRDGMGSPAAVCSEANC